MRIDVRLLAAFALAGVCMAVGACGEGTPRIPRLAAADNVIGGGGLEGCVDLGPAPKLEELQARFVNDIYPLMVRGEAGCIACHDEASGRSMRVSTPAGDNVDSATSTFLRLRSGGFFGIGPGTATTRIVDESMPLGGPAWSDNEQILMERLSCDLRRVDADNPVPLDEQFPAELLLPYAGAPVLDYDNAFVNYAQLRGRVDVVFDDEWVREGTDQFSANIALFGGVDFISTFVPARQATAEFLAGLVLLAEDVCDRAATDGTGPFVGVNLTAPLVDEPVLTSILFEAEAPEQTIVGLPADCLPNANATRVGLCTNAFVSADYEAPSAGDYRVSAVVQPVPNGPDDSGAPIVELRVDGRAGATITVPGIETTTITGIVHIDARGTAAISVAFTNDSNTGGDRNLILDSFTVEGPLPGTTDGVVDGKRSARAAVATMAGRILQRPFVDSLDDDIDETGPLYDVLLAMNASEVSNRRSAWAGVCEAVVQHPDFLFTRPPTFDTSTDAALRERLLTMQAALVLLDRTPTNDELGRLDLGEVDRPALIEQWLASPDHDESYRNRVREILEFDGTPDGEEPARLWSYIERNDRPLKEVLTADYTVDVAGNRIDRPAEHGQTGVLTMRGYIVGKPGLPHYNYAARVMTGFMGRVFEVPQAALDARETATATSTVDPTSLCFSCHNVLTPLVHQRQKWDDDGVYREVYEDGRVIDDSDNNLVAGYPFTGNGVEAFSLVAVKKEAFARRMANAHFLMVFGRLLRLAGRTADEGAVYQQLYTAIAQGNGTFKDVERLILSSSSVTSPPLTPDVAPLTGLLAGAP